jgi:hypothetical protein
MGTLGCGAITSTGGLSAIAGSFQTNNLTTYSLNVQNIQEDTSGVAINFMAVKTGVAETSGNLRNAARIRAWFSGVNNDDGIISLRGFDGTNTEFGILTADSDNAGRVGILNDAPSYVLDVNGTFRAAGAAIFGADVTFNESILFDDAHGMYIEPSSTTWNFGSNSSSNLTAAFGNAGSGVMNMTIDGSLLLGVAGTSRGSCILYNGAGGNTAGYVILYSRNATPYYLWVEDDMTLKVSAAAPVNNADGTVVGAQT